jgi:hypothetical protein
VDQGWRKLASTPRDSRAIASSFVLSPFARLARAHGFQAAGDAMVAVALADSVFFSASVDAARSKVALYLLLTVLPFSVLSPLIGPFIDRMAGGRRLMLILTAALRAIAAIGMVGNLDSLALYPLAFVHLVSIKAYGVAKTAVVPALVHTEDQLVEANAKLGLISGVCAFAGVIPVLPFAALGWSSVIAVVAGLVFSVAALIVRGLPRSTVAASDAPPAELAELRSSAIVLAATTTAVLRAIVGFMTFMVVFALRTADAGTVWIAAAVTLSALGSVTANATAASVRQVSREEVLIGVSLAAIGGTSVLVALAPSNALLCLLAAVIGAFATYGKLSFDAIVQRDAPDANQGRSLARFETRFQIAWVIAAFVPVLIDLSVGLGAAIIAVVALLGAGGYAIGRRSLRSQGTVPEVLADPVAWAWRRRPVGRRTKTARPEPGAVEVVGHESRPSSHTVGATWAQPSESVSGVFDREPPLTTVEDATQEFRDRFSVFSRPPANQRMDSGALDAVASSDAVDEPLRPPLPPTAPVSDPSPVGAVPVTRRRLPRPSADPTLPLDWDDQV